MEGKLIVKKTTTGKAEADPDHRAFGAGIRACAVALLALAAMLAVACPVQVEPQPKLSGRVFIEPAGPGRRAAGENPIFQVGDRIRANTDGLSGSGPQTFLWRRGIDPIPGEKGKTYTLRDEDVGFGIAVIVFTDGNEGGIISDPTFPVLRSAVDVSGNTLGRAASEVDISGTLWVGKTLGAEIKWRPGNADQIGTRFQWMRSEPSLNEPISNGDYTAILGANDGEYTLTRVDMGRWIKVVAVHPDYDWYVDGYHDEGAFGTGRLEALAYGPVTEPGPIEVTGPNSVARDFPEQYVARRGDESFRPAQWMHDEHRSSHPVSGLTEEGLFRASYGEANRWHTIRASEGTESGSKTVRVRSRPAPGDWRVVFAKGKGIRHDGELWSWGENELFGTVGNGGRDYVAKPVKITGYEDWVAIASGEMHMMALRSGGELYVWGSNQYGMLGLGDPIGTSENDPREIRVPTRLGGAEWSSISAGSYHNFAVKKDGTLWAWGRNNGGHLGAGYMSEYEPRPIRIGQAGWRQVIGATSHSMGIDSDGVLHTWGRNHFGTLGNGQSGNWVEAHRHTPTPVETGARGWKQVAGSNFSSYAIDEDGILWSWGSNMYGQLGRESNEFTGWIGPQSDSNHTRPISTRPDRVEHEYGGRWRSVYALPGTAHVLAIDERGELWAWGENHHGQIGNGDSGHGKIVRKPVRVVLSEAPDATWLSAGVAYGAEAELSGGGVSMAVMADDGKDGTLNGSLWAWGDNSTGALGIGHSTGTEPRPVRVRPPQ
ncbi:MAG: hypothetical protein FWD94_00250 [Treponema sp.]|nr:hypothetical protein [Treponema sp.]